MKTAINSDWRQRGEAPIDEPNQREIHPDPFLPDKTGMPEGGNAFAIVTQRQKTKVRRSAPARERIKQ